MCARETPQRAGLAGFWFAGAAAAAGEAAGAAAGVSISPYAAMPAPATASRISAPASVNPCWRLPALIALRGAAHVVDGALVQVGRRHGDPGRGRLGERVRGDGAQVALGHEVVER